MIFFSNFYSQKNDSLKKQLRIHCDQEQNLNYEDDTSESGFRSRNVRSKIIHTSLYLFYNILENIRDLMKEIEQQKYSLIITLKIYHENYIVKIFIVKFFSLFFFQSSRLYDYNQIEIFARNSLTFIAFAREFRSYTI